MHQADLAIVTQSLVKRYRTSSQVETTVLNDASLTIKKGNLAVILGASGSGKTTLLNILGAIDVPDRGDVWVSGFHLNVMKSKEIIAFRRQQIGFIFQFYNLMPTLTALENVEVSLEHQKLSRHDKVAQAQTALAAVGLGNAGQKFPNQMSGGEQQRVAVARALVRKPAVLLCDEPTGNLDAKSGENVVTLIETLCRKQGTTAVVVTHNPALFTKPDQIFHMVDGKLKHQSVSMNPIGTVCEA